MLTLWCLPCVSGTLQFPHVLQEAVAVAGDWLEAQKLDIRVGKVISAELHPDADRLVLI